MTPHFIFSQRLWRLTAAIVSALLWEGAAGAIIPDSITVCLDSLTVSAAAPAAVRVSASGVTELNARLLADGVRVGGELDLAKLLLTLPGVSAAGDYASGFSIDGGDPGHNMFTVAGAKVFHPYRMGGIFSTFNADHYPAMQLHRLPSADTGGSGAMGATMRVMPSLAAARKPRLKVNAGMLASTATAVVPATDKLTITASGRASYIDQIYGRWLDDKNWLSTYGFHDCAFTAMYRPSGSNSLMANFMASRDRMTYVDRRKNDRSGMSWRNLAASVQWRSEGTRPMEHTVFHSRFASLLDYDLDSFDGKLRSSIEVTGIHGKIQAYTTADERVTVAAGYGVEHTSSLSAERNLNFHESGSISSAGCASRSVMSELWANAAISLAPGVTLTPRVRGSAQWSADCARSYLDPDINLLWRNGVHSLSLSGGIFTQYLHLGSISDIGMASNFWLDSGPSLAPERAAAASASYSLRLGDVSPYTLTVSAFAKRLSGCIQFDGNILEMMNRDYNLLNHFARGRGHAVGFDLMARRSSGSVTGWTTYSWTRSRRLFAPAEGWVRAAGIPTHSATFNAAWRIGQSWVLSGNFFINSGRPYTPVRALYLINENVVIEYGRRNSATLPAYHHLDLGATYKFTSTHPRAIHHSINLSVFNIYGHRNIEMTSYVLDVENLQFRRRNVFSKLRFLPSVSYSIEL